MNAKYVNGMPLDRIATDFPRKRNEVNISKQVMALTGDALRRYGLSFRLPGALKYGVFKRGYELRHRRWPWAGVSMPVREIAAGRVIILYGQKKTRKTGIPKVLRKGFTNVIRAPATAYEMDPKLEISPLRSYHPCPRIFALSVKARAEKIDEARGSLPVALGTARHRMDNQLSERRRRYRPDKTIVEALFAVEKDQA